MRKKEDGMEEEKKTKTRRRRKKSQFRKGKEIEEKRLELINRKGVVFHHDNARPHTSLVTRQKLLEFGWDVLPHPPYSPDLAPSDYFLFRSLQNSLNGKNFNNDDDIKLYLIHFFANKNQKFYERRIMMLPKRWQKIKMGNTL
ncbi:transposase [Apis mellifera caucasica]|nr:transposase [Apis mellifera caucasica]